MSVSAGRTAVGSCYRLYSSECYDNMMPETVPEILRLAQTRIHTCIQLYIRRYAVPIILDELVVITYFVSVSV